MTTAATHPRPPATVARQLARFYARTGFVRNQNRQRFKHEGTDRYKKGDEVRLIVDSLDELTHVQELLDRAGFKVSRPFQKRSQYCQPLYGRQAVARFLEMVNKEPDA